jgi:hypothetical protein
MTDTLGLGVPLPHVKGHMTRQLTGGRSKDDQCERIDDFLKTKV